MKESFNKKTDKSEGRKVRPLYADLSGIYATSIQGYKYYLVVSCDASRLIWLKLLKSKHTQEVYPALQEIRAKAKKATNKKCVYFRADNGTGEFGNIFQESLTLDRVQFELSPVYKHSINSVIKGAIRIISIIARSILYKSRLPYQLWDYAVEHAIWIKNRVLTTALLYRKGDIFVSTSIIPYRTFTRNHLDFQYL